MVFSTFWVMITRNPGRPEPWNAWKARSCTIWASQTRTPRAPENYTSTTTMSDHHHKDEASAGNGRHASLLERLSHFLGRGHAHAMRESLEEVIEESDRQSPDLSPQERRMLANLLKFGELRVGDVMVPRADIVAIEERTSLKELVESLRAEQHSRLPVYRETLDDPIGLVHMKDVL